MSQVEGRNPVNETMKRGGVKKLLVAIGITEDPKIRDILALAKYSSIPVELLPRERLDKRSETKHHQGIIALVDAPVYVSFRSVVEKSGKDPCMIILDSVQDPQNLGSILRTADAAEVDAVLIPKKEGVGLTPTVLRVSMGGGAKIPVARESVYPAIKLLKDEDFKVIGIDARGSINYWDADLRGAVAFVFGGEGEGISPTLLDKCDIILRIPMRKEVNSLNVGVSVALILYERLRQKSASR